MLVVAKKYPKVQVTVRLHPRNLALLEKLGEAAWLNRSEMIDRAIEEYVRSRRDELISLENKTAPGIPAEGNQQQQPLRRAAKDIRPRGQLPRASNPDPDKPI